MVDRDTRPVPDPTYLTTEALNREIAGLRELLQTQRQGDLDLNNERFKRVDTQFNDRDQRISQLAVENARSVDKAFAAAKEATSEQKQTFTKQNDDLRDQVGKIDTRVIIMETSGRTSHDVKGEGFSQKNAMTQTIITGAALAVAAATTLLNFWHPLH